MVVPVVQVVEVQKVHQVIGQPQVNATDDQDVFPGQAIVFHGGILQHGHNGFEVVFRVGCEGHAGG
jgi:hypothetical protein